MALNQSTQFKIIKLYIHDKENTVKLDIQNLFDELNIFESILFPCMSGNIVITDAIGLSSKLNFDGNQYITMEIQKGSERNESGTADVFLERRFVLWKQTDRKELNQTSEMYTLHFVSEEFLLSTQKKVKQSYKGTYSDIVLAILKDHLKLEYTTPQIGHFLPSKGLHTFNVPNLSPFEAINYISKRAINEKGLADYIFWQTQYGYNFISLSTISSYSDPLATITFGVKNVDEITTEEEMFGARDVRVISQFDVMDSISQGAHSGKFIGFDTLTGQVVTKELSFEKDIYSLEKNRMNKNNVIRKVYNKENKSSFEMYDSKVTLYPFHEKRIDSSHLKKKDSNLITYMDDTHNYVYQRSALINNLMQKRIRITMPGYFGYYPGYSVNLLYPKRFAEKDGNMYDQTLSGRYIILSARHIIRFDKHETILEVAADSSMRGDFYE